MPNFHNKKLLLFLASVIILATIIPLILLYFFLPSKETRILSKNIETQKELYAKNLPLEEVDKNISIFKSNFKSSKDRYEALKIIKVYFDIAYYSNSSPELRELIESLDIYASGNLNKEYRKIDFIVICSDEKCGEKTPQEIESIIQEIDSSSINDAIKKIIIQDLRSTSHQSSENKDAKLNKIFGYTSAMVTLMKLKDPKASESALKIREFVNKTYGEKI